MLKSVEIKDFCGIEAQKINLNKVTVICGKSMQGKTTIVEAIRWAIFGDNDQSFVRNDAESCDVTLRTDNGSTVVRSMMRGGKSRIYFNRLVDGESVPVSEPQTQLSKLFIPTSLDPVSLLQMKPKDLAKTINEALSDRVKLTKDDLKELEIEGVEFPENANHYQIAKTTYDLLYAERTDVNRDVKEYETKTKDIIQGATQEMLDEERRVLKATQKALDEANSANAKIEANRNALEVFEKTQKAYNELMQKINTSDDFDATAIKEKISKYSKSVEEVDEKYHRQNAALKSIKGALEKIDGEIKCPLGKMISCKTDMKIYKDQFTSDIEELSAELKQLFAEGGKLKEELNATLETQKVLEDQGKYKLEASRLKSLLDSISNIGEHAVEPVEEGTINGYKAQIQKSQKRIANLEVSLKMQSVSNIEEKRKRQVYLNETLKKLTEVMTVYLPKKMALSVKGVSMSDDGLYFKDIPFKRLGDSYKLRLTTAIIKDLYPKANLFTLDGCEKIDPAEFEKVAKRYAQEEGNTQYILTYVGTVPKSLSETQGINVIEMSNFKAIGA